MRLNIYVPKGKEPLLERLDRVSELTGRSKNDLVLEALERYLTPPRPVLGKFRLGNKDLGTRREWYEEWNRG